jgi:hypothetical protein
MSTCLAGCYFTPDTGSGERDGGIQPPNDLFGADARTADGGGMGCASESPLVSMRVRVRTTTPNGRYSPRNIGAIWIETEQGMFVKTIERWAGTRARWLTKFNASWNLTNLMHCEIPSGNYRVVVEMTDKNGAGPSTTIPFTMNGTPMTLTPVETTNFHDLLIELK